MTMTFSSPSTPSISDSNCGTMVFSTSEGDAGTPGAEDRVHLVEEHDHPACLPRPSHGPAGRRGGCCRSVSPTYLFSSSGPLMLRKKDFPSSGFLLPVRVRLCLGSHLLGEGVRHRLGDERLAAAGRAVEQDALRRTELVLLVEVGVKVGQLDGVADLLDLPSEAADVGVRDVRDLFEDELLDLGLRKCARTRSRSAARAAASRPPESPGRASGEASRTIRSFVGVRDDQGALAVGEQLLHHHDFADRLVALGYDDVQRLVEHDLLAGPEPFQFDVGADVHPHLAPAR